VSEDGATITSDPGSGVIKAGWHCGGDPNTTGSAGTCPTCKRCEGTSCVPVADSPPIAPAAASPVPPAVQDAGDAVALNEFGANTGFGYTPSLTCSAMCVAGGEKAGMSGDITPAAAWSVKIHTRAQLPGCAAATRTAANIARTTTHELKHASLLMSVINNAKSVVGTVYGSMQACTQAKTAAISQLQAAWSAMVARQVAHTDFAGEMRYGFACQGGVTVEVPSGTTY
jgi:hypothetical protein